MDKLSKDNDSSIQSLADEYFHKIKQSNNLSELREALEKAQSAALKNLALAMRKTLPEAMVQELIDRADPLGAFLRELRQ